ncbi:Ribosomal-protein-alanine acetyltransferase [Mycena venus]|uniref:Ribosomal-protein-alanine acetyltransferase n=1 Tax=Mycena venus TaxID=2733690 RepID=A0A8H7D022_9AGAR|nr:Ribosomal-protein-alanine acetyltransferase [Mycena venus]
MATSLQELEELLGLLTDARTTNELAVAALTAVILEHIINFPDEVNLIWKSRFSISNVAYIWIRYFTLLAICIDVSFMLRAEGSDHLCQSFLFGEMVVSTIIVISADLILIFRVWILYERSRNMLYLMVPLVTAEIIAMITVGVYTIKPLKQYVHVGPLLAGCYSFEVPRLFTFYAVPPFVTAVLMFLMTAFKCGTTLMTHGPGKTPIIAVFMRDGVFWFLALLLVSIVEIVLWDRARPTLAQIPVVPSTAFIAIIGARVVLNIKHVASNTLKGAATTMGTELEVRRPLAGEVNTWSTH